MTPLTNEQRIRIHACVSILNNPYNRKDLAREHVVHNAVLISRSYRPACSCNYERLFSRCRPDVCIYPWSNRCAYPLWPLFRVSIHALILHLFHLDQDAQEWRRQDVFPRVFRSFFLRPLSCSSVTLSIALERRTSSWLIDVLHAKVPSLRGDQRVICASFEESHAPHTWAPTVPLSILNRKVGRLKHIAKPSDWALASNS